MPFATLKGSGAHAPKAKDLRYLQLWDLYGGLLTDHQREICEMYYGYDLSLMEIAEEKGVSKQSVSEVLKKSRELLDGFEEKLRLNEQNQAYSLEVSYMMTNVTRAIEAFKTKHPEFTAEMDEIEKKVAVGEEIGLDGEEVLAADRKENK